jgi:hypothetical protein
VKSRTSADALELGSELVKELGDTAENDLLARWMAEYLGEKLTRAKKARGTQREALANECVELILRLWAHRHFLPKGGRPLESFEPIFKTLNDLSQDKPRYPLLRNLPEPKKGSEVEKLIAGALALDASASSLIRYTLAEAVAMLPERDKRWVKLRAVTKDSPWDIQIVYRVMSDAETLADKATRLNKAQIDKVKGMQSRLKGFEEMTTALRSLLEDKLKALTQD